MGKSKGLIFLLCSLGIFIFVADAEQKHHSRSSSVFRPGEGVRITVFPDSEHFLSGDYSIDSDGRILLPMYGEINVSSMSASQFREFITTNFKQYLRFPEVQVTPLMRISVLGGFFEPGMYYVSPKSSLWDLVYMAGGTVHENGLRRMRWERSRVIVQRDLIRYLESGVSLEEAGFRSGDQIWTPADPSKTFWSAVVRDVVIRDILPLATFMLSLYVSLSTINN
ncbi:polysaccharide export protein [Chitinispirillum alkaliphilum]|nr:polysaccharide export protein [Chitinispirillum alkaliphilum]